MRSLAILLVLSATSGLAADKPMISSLRSDGTLLVNDKPILPYGFYISTGHTGDMRLKCVENVAKIGGNVIHIQGPWDNDTRFLDRATELGIWVVAGHTETDEKLARVRQFKDHPAIIAWTLFDDANTLTTVDHLVTMNNKVKAIVPHRLTFVPLGTQSQDIPIPAKGFFSCSDFVGWEIYPIASPKAADSSLRATETQMAQIAALADKAKRPYWVLPQSFAWPGGRAPSAAEYRNICYVGLVNGAKGVMPWSIYHNVESELRAKKMAEGKPAWQEWYLPHHQELWAECALVASELKELSPILLNESRTKLTSQGNVTAARWVYEHESLVILANLSEINTATVSLPLAKSEGCALIPVLKGRPAGLKLRDGNLVGEMGKAEVHVYRLKSSQ